MLVALSIDMEGASHLREMREAIACCPEYWQSGKPALEADVVAAARGLLSGGASEVVVLDNHASGNTFNVGDELLPAGTRQESWHVFDLHQHGVDAMLQVGYHARAGVNGFLSHTYAPGLQLRVGDELISESHGRAWAADVPLLGIVGNDEHERTLGSLTGTPFLVVQKSNGRAAADPAFGDPSDSADAIRGFAEACARAISSAPTFEPPTDVPLRARLENGDGAAAQMEAAGWTRATDAEFVVDLEAWQDARLPVAAAMNAGMAPVIPFWLSNLSTRGAALAADAGKAEQLTQYLVEWGNEPPLEWPAAAASA